MIRIIIGVILIVFSVWVIHRLRRRHVRRPLVALIALLLMVVLMIFGTVEVIGGGLAVADGHTPATTTTDVFGPKNCGPGTGYSKKLHQCVANTTTVAIVKGYDLHYYSRDAGVPQGYFGPACVAGGDPNVCKASLKERVKHDPDLASAMMRDFNLLPGQVSTMTPAQVEQLREQFSAQLAKDVNLRVKTATAIATVLDSMVNFHIEQLSGTFYTEGITPTGQIFQTQKVMNPSVNNAIVGTTPDGVTLSIKDDCGFQTVSKAPIPGVPPETPPSLGPPTSVPSPTSTVPVEHGKDPTKGIIYAPIPTSVQGCGADGGPTQPCTGSTATNHPVQATPPPASGTTQCGDGNQQCPTPTSTTTTTAPPPPPRVTLTPAPAGGGSGPSPSPIVAGSGDPGFGGSV